MGWPDHLEGWVSFIYLNSGLLAPGTGWRGLQGNKMHGLGKFYLFKILVCRLPVPDCQASKMPILVKSVLVLFNIATSIIQYAWMCYAIQWKPPGPGLPGGPSYIDGCCFLH